MLGLLAACATSTTESTVEPAPASSGKSAAAGDAASAAAPVTNLAHLNFLMDTVPLLTVPGHTTYKMAEQPSAQAPWTYADKTADGYKPVGGGDYNPATKTYSQGAYNSDDISRTAVVYLKHWKQTGDAASKERAYQTLRELTYLQTDSGPNAGNVVLWQQADGALNPEPTPVEYPNPSDSAESFWVARTVWALGVGYAAFMKSDPAFAAFLQDRLQLSLAALNRQSLSKFGKYDIATGVKVPAWLIVGEADASAEAVLGLTAYVKVVPTDTLASKALKELTNGIAMMSRGSVNQWPYGAILPQNSSQGLWHAWAGMAPAALAGASAVLPGANLTNAAVKDAAQFTPQLMTAGGPYNDWAPTPSGSQIAYGVDSRVQALVATGNATRAPGLLNVAAITAGWFFGANESGAPAYDRTTGACVDGIEPGGKVNKNSGAESTIQALLTMLTLDANPKVKALALGINKTVSTHGLTVVTPESGTATLKAGGTVTISVAADDQARNVYAVVNQSVAPAGSTTWSAGATQLGVTANGGAGAQGIAPAPGFLFPFALKTALPGSATSVVGTTDGSVVVQSLLIQPLVSSVSVTGPGGDSTLYVSAGTTTSSRQVVVPDGFKLAQQVFDSVGKPVLAAGNPSQPGAVTVAPGGFTVTQLVRK